MLGIDTKRRIDTARDILVGKAPELWVIHAFQKKSSHGIKTPKHEIDLMKDRLKRLKEVLR